MKRYAVSVLATALIAATGGASAYDRDYRDSGYDGDGYRARYSAYDQDDVVRYDYARVESVDPIIDRYRTDSRVHCWYEPSSSVRYYDRSGNPTGAVIGAIVGGALGNQVGKGDGRKAATVAGAAIGGSIGYNSGRSGYVGSSGDVRRCERVGDYDRDRDYERVVAYRVTYRYAGQTYHTVTDYNPGSRMRVTVQVQPQERGVAYH